jgi:hypothetical protein
VRILVPHIDNRCANLNLCDRILLPQLSREQIDQTAAGNPSSDRAPSPSISAKTSGEG